MEMCLKDTTMQLWCIAQRSLKQSYGFLFEHGPNPQNSPGWRAKLYNKVPYYIFVCSKGSFSL